ncbi:MAG: hypothetical protein M0R23_08905 [Bacteroidales bacterium]|jgi:hypothetical protein|nr:hypothetical protein [Bacteroidales bacterium]
MLGYDKVYNILRKLANTQYYQALYTREDLRIFNNNGNLSDIQLTFLNLLGFYNALNMDVSMGEADQVVFDDFIYEDAYMYYKSHKNDNKEKKIPETNGIKRKNIRPIEKLSNQITQQKSQWIFK